MQASTRATKRSTTPRQRRAAARRKELRVHAEGKIDEFLRTIGVKDPSDETDEDGARHLFCGDVHGFAKVDTSDDVVVLTVAAEVMPLPADQELIVPLMRELLEHNSDIWGTPRFAIGGDCVWLGAMRRVEEMADDDYAAEIEGVMFLAAAVAKDLKKRYGGTTRKRKR